MQKNKPLVLMILDGWGFDIDKQYNAIASANTPQWDLWWQNNQHMLLDASGGCVGLPDGQMGNSEVGHMHIGAGRIIKQDLTRINEAISNNSFNKNSILINLIQETNNQGKTLHIMGLLSTGGVHSHEEHLFSFLNLCALNNCQQLSLHLFLDGRDSPPESALKSIEVLEQHLEKYKFATIRSITGRYFAMDRDKHWDRTEQVYLLLTDLKADYHFNDAKTAINSFYLQNKSDEFIPPTLIGSPNPIEDGDSIFFFNFRADRARQLTQAFVDEKFEGFTRSPQLQLTKFVSMTSYGDNLPVLCAYQPIILNNTLGEVIANNGLRQLRLAETEKYAHVTFFLNGGREDTFPNEDRELIASPNVATFDLLPEMSAPKLTATLINAIQSGSYDVIFCNYANADMVGHSGNFSATIDAINCLDKCMQQVWQVLNKVGGCLLITADHGNAEVMFDEISQQPHTAHTSLPVPLLYIGENWHFNRTRGSLIDVAPTVIAILHLQKPKEMTGSSVLSKNVCT